MLDVAALRRVGECARGGDALTANGGVWRGDLQTSSLAPSHTSDLRVARIALQYSVRAHTSDGLDSRFTTAHGGGYGVRTYQ